ncbi:endolytic transglycosylase MltG [Oribacterium sp. WCC10]|uniref:endolytic transglycosylase MltG n=1 Tax=Oribacterium sp. WCC10 TaxID=1855343 RepID=UPI0008F014EC|nr:endolytic transglycosylase MltG [Oribacterium sp. WCC10]SFG38808.1 YceG-like family protein [Oribacterium sp. WCC10]
MGHQDTIERVANFLIGIAWRVIVIALLVYALMNGVRAAYSYGHGLLYSHAMAGDNAIDEDFVISEGDKSADVAERLLKEGFIDNADAFNVQAKLYEAEFVPGVYTISKSMTMVEIIQLLTQEGKKYQELVDKNLVDAEATTTAAAEVETDANGIEVIGGTEDEQMIEQDAADAALRSQEAEQYAGGNASAGNTAETDSSLG